MSSWPTTQFPSDQDPSPEDRARDVAAVSDPAAREPEGSGYHPDRLAPEEPSDQEVTPWITAGAGSGDVRNSNVRVAIAVAVVAAGLYFFGPYALLIIGALLVSIILHEFGHYWTAKRCGMKVTEFFVGFGPKIWSFRRGETEYGFKVIPAGAYVRIIGMNNLEDVDPADEARCYRQQSAPKRMAVVLAGPFMNMLIAVVLLFSLFLLHGAPTDQWTVGKVQAGTAAAAAGLQEGDRIITVAGDPVSTWTNFRDQLNEKAGTTVPFVIERNGEQMTLNANLGWRLSAEGAAAIPSSPALVRSDQVMSANGAPVATWAELRALLSQPGDPVKLQIDRNTSSYELVVSRPVANLPTAGAGGFLGVEHDPVVVKETPAGAIGETAGQLKDVLVGTGAAFGHLFTPAGIQNYAGQVADSARPTDTVVASAQPGVLTPIGGSAAPSDGSSADSARPTSIIGIVQVGSEAAQLSLWVFIGLVAIVNFSLALINLLPILPFDGGHAVIAAYEGVRGTIRGERYQADLTKMLPVVYGVFAVLVLLGTTSMLLDILKPQSIGP